MKINLSLAIDYLKEQYQDGEISSGDLEELTTIVLTYSIYEAAVYKEWEEYAVMDEKSQERAHEYVLDGLIRDLIQKRKATH